MSLTQKQMDNELDRWLRENPPSPTCPSHPGRPAEVDRDSMQAKALEDPTGSIIFLRHLYVPCEQCRDTRLVAQLKTAGVPPSLLHCTLDNWHPPDKEAEAQLLAVREFCQERRGFLFLLGHVGLGKSHLAVGVLRRLGHGHFVRQAELLRRLRATYRDEDALDPIEPCKKAGLLVLDEMGLSAGGKDEWPMLHEILDHRYCSMHPTVITSNLSWEELFELVGDRLADRFRECAFRVLALSGESQRSIARERYFNNKAPPS